MNNHLRLIKFTITLSLILLHNILTFAVDELTFDATKKAISIYWAQPNNKTFTNVINLENANLKHSRESLLKTNSTSLSSTSTEVEKVKLHWRIQSALEDCLVGQKNNELKKRILLGVQSAKDWKNPCPSEPINGLDNLKDVVNTATHSFNKQALDKIRLSFINEFIEVSHSLEANTEVKDLIDFCNKISCPAGATEILQRPNKNNSTSLGELSEKTWQSLDDYKNSKFIGSKQSLLLASDTLKPFLKKSISRSEFDQLIPKAKDEILTKVKIDINAEFENIKNENLNSQAPSLVNQNLLNMIRTYPTVVGAMLAKNPELTSVICHSLQTSELPPTQEQLSKDWLWLGGSTLLSAGLVFLAPQFGIPMTLSRISSAAFVAVATKDGYSENRETQEIYDESARLRNEFFSGSGSVDTLSQSDAKDEEAYNKLTQNYLNVAQALPIGKLGSLAKYIKISDSAKDSVQSMNLFSDFLNLIKNKIVDARFTDNFNKLYQLINADEMDLVMGSMSKLGPTTHKYFVKFIEKLSSDANQRMRKLIQVLKEKGC